MIRPSFFAFLGFSRVANKEFWAAHANWLSQTSNLIIPRQPKRHQLQVLPAYSSHLTQRPEIGLAGPLKADVTRQMDRASAGRLREADWALRLFRARARLMTTHNVKVAWKFSLQPLPHSALDSFASLSSLCACWSFPYPPVADDRDGWTQGTTDAVRNRHTSLQAENLWLED